MPAAWWQLPHCRHIVPNPVAPYRRQQASRVARDLREMLDHKSDPGVANKTEGERHAYATPLTATEVWQSVAGLV